MKPRFLALETAAVAAAALLVAAAHGPGARRLLEPPSGPARRPEGLVFQKAAYDCGDAALTMVLRRFGVDASFEEVRRELRTPPTGASMLSLRELARRKGLACEGWRLTARDVDAMALPALVRLRSRHFAVLERRTAGGDLVLLDPARGELVLSRRTFASLWTGETLLFAQPGAAGTPRGPPPSLPGRMR